MRAAGKLRRLLRVVLALLALVIVALAAFIIWKQSLWRLAVPGRSARTVRQATSGPQVAAVPTKGTAADPVSWTGRTDGEAVWIEVARRKAGYPVPLPTYLPAGATFVQAYWIPPAPPQNMAKWVELRYASGLLLRYTRSGNTADPQELVDYLNSPAQRGSAAESAPWLIFDVNGIKAMAREAGSKTASGRSLRTPPAAISWWNDGIMYEVYDSSGPPLSELLRVAESLK